MLSAIFFIGSFIYKRYREFILLIISSPKTAILVALTTHVFITQTALADPIDLDAINRIKVTGYLESYYSHDLYHSSADTRPEFAYSHHVLGKPSVNLAIIKTSYDDDKVRANLALGSGTYMRANYAQEPDNVQKIYEANFGVKLSRQQQVWLDAGVMSSHVGFESAIGLHNWTLTRSMMADNSPYFETGAKLSYSSDDGRWYASGLIVNGWQRIQRVSGNTSPTIGHQLTFRPNMKWTFNSSSLVGNDQSDRDRRMRYFHHFYMQYHGENRWSLIAGFDIGAQQKTRGDDQYDMWFSPILIGRYRHSELISMALRAEYYQDANGVIVDLQSPGHEFKTLSYSANLDYVLEQNINFRVELRKFESKDKIFGEDNDQSRHSLILTSALIFNF